MNVLGNVSKRTIMTFSLIFLAVMLPWALRNEYLVHIATAICLWSILATSVNVISGYTGQIAAGQGAFWGISGYCCSLLVTKLGVNYWLAFLIGVFGATFVSFLIAIPAVTTRGPYFVICTLAFNVILTIIIENWDNLTGGTNGVVGIPPPDAIGPISFSSTIAQYYLILFFLVLSLFITHRLINSLIGRTFVSIREDEDLAESLGINTRRNKILSFVIAGAISGIGGCLYGSFKGLLVPSATNIFASLDAIIFCIIGGNGTLPGPVIGSLIFLALPELAQVLPELLDLIRGLTLLVFIIFLPGGIVRGVRLLWSRIINNKLMRVHTNYDPSDKRAN